jgi:hypothetical protein
MIIYPYLMHTNKYRLFYILYALGHSLNSELPNMMDKCLGSSQLHDPHSICIANPCQYEWWTKDAQKMGAKMQMKTGGSEEKYVEGRHIYLQMLQHGYMLNFILWKSSRSISLIFTGHVMHYCNRACMWSSWRSMFYQYYVSCKWKVLSTD